MVSRFWRTASPGIWSLKGRRPWCAGTGICRRSDSGSGSGKTTSKGSSGSRWETYKVVYKDGKEISRELDHKTTYKGHKPVVHRNTSGVVLNPEETTTQATTVTPTVDGMPEGYTGPAETTQSQPGSGTASSAPAEGPGSASTEPSSVPVAPAPSEDAPSGSQGGPGAGAVVVPVKPE